MLTIFTEKLASIWVQGQTQVLCFATKLLVLCTHTQYRQQTTGSPGKGAEHGLTVPWTTSQKRPQLYVYDVTGDHSPHHPIM